MITKNQLAILRNLANAAYQANMDIGIGANVLLELLDGIEEARSTIRRIAHEIGCDAGNFDGGSAASCEHCQLLASIGDK